MSKQTTASEYWAHQIHSARIKDLCTQATNYMYPAGQVQAGIQLGTVAVPYLLERIAQLEEELSEKGIDSRERGSVG